VGLSNTVFFYSIFIGKNGNETGNSSKKGVKRVGQKTLTTMKNHTMLVTLTSAMMKEKRMIFFLVGFDWLVRSFSERGV
jgi:hypothetical protein